MGLGPSEKGRPIKKKNIEKEWPNFREAASKRRLPEITGLTNWPKRNIERKRTRKISLDKSFRRRRHEGADQMREGEKRPSEVRKGKNSRGPKKREVGR